MRSTVHFGLLILRVGVSILMLFHGIPKLLEVIQGNFEFGDPIGLGPVISKIGAVIGEAICPILIIIGVRTRLATIPTIITMAVAAFIVHGSDPIQRKELALLYLVAFVAIALTGAGKYSIDRK
ncbi:MAG: DoxX family protein [Flavobacteriales bacterium]|jgi:putative oxidoreductase|uniref:DoxX family protein n=1 Tax=Candidatus Ulvibacter alkanivorans TaxID=2267620 RepID=UPI000DF24E58|nr:DoxX family protein [Candidatus Ulvibacter alkanivorans]MCH2488650.1 DoxX family protein [Flavobacteriales bacterium]